MGRLIASRALATIPVLLGIAVVSFFMIRLVPGDVVDSILGTEYADPVLEAQMRAYYGIDQPVHVQFVQWFGGVLRGDLGVSYRTGRPVTEEILTRFPATLELTLAALVVSVAIAVPLGVLSAVRRNGAIDVTARVTSLIGLSIPNFWLGILLILVFAVHLRWLPSGGSTEFSLTWDHLRHLILPAVTLGSSLAAVTLRMTRSSLLEVLGEDYVRTARAKGLRTRAVVGVHGLRNALIPVVTVVGIQAGALLGGTVVVEQVFSLPGLGTLVVNAIGTRDYAIVQGSVMFLAAFYVLVSLIVDIVYLYLDPRLRHAR
ncbi:nickel ABC transporter permease [Litorihabitans aurantiacus]|uniref:Nickel import system permease protein NikB n=1 Tax=Litorihabitans aurantiacus TaxID=1930061 RepID=A0AA37UWJ6_9MICO|nr:nickel ABC transporter permease [Litorihabitans aurantiacus]GMA30397.1 ABC transporter permease [Litorihabitans aurantiacus]